jgi:transcriptional regulator with XRE-family HTH domain
MDEFSASARMNHYEIGRHQPDFETLKRIAIILKLPVAYFYAETDALAEILKIFSFLNKIEKNSLIKELKSRI